MIENIELIFREQMNDKLQPLRDRGCKIYSISRLNNMNTCPRQYYLTYVAKEQQKAGIYGILGTACHSDLEDLYENKEEGARLVPKHFKDEWMKCEMFGVNFPTEPIKKNYKKDIDAFYKYYKKREGQFISELGFILQIDEMHYLMGYIDLLELREDGKVNIFDFKTSAMFKDKKLIDAGRQLCIYQMALEQLYGLECVINGWEMLKYCNLQIGNNKPRVVSAREVVDKAETQLKTLLKKNKYDEQQIHMYIMMCKQQGDFSCLPQEIQDQIKVEIHFKEYEITDEVKAETMKYITDTIAIIESIDDTNINKWETNPNDFFCKNLCGFHPKHCQGY